MAQDYPRIAEDFNKALQELALRRYNMSEALAYEFILLYVAVRPIVDVLKAHNLYFRHPDNQELKTLIGPIVGQDTQDTEDEDDLYFFVYSGEFVYRVSLKHERIDATMNMINLGEFLSNNDIEFALNGLNWVASCIDDIIEEKTTRIYEIESIAQGLLLERTQQDEPPEG